MMTGNYAPALENPSVATARVYTELVDGVGLWRQSVGNQHSRRTTNSCMVAILVLVSGPIPSPTNRGHPWSRVCQLNAVPCSSSDGRSDLYFFRFASITGTYGRPSRPHPCRNLVTFPKGSSCGHGFPTRRSSPVSRCERGSYLRGDRWPAIVGAAGPRHSGGPRGRRA